MNEHLTVIVNSSTEINIKGSEYKDDNDLFPLILKKYQSILREKEWDGHKLSEESVNRSIHNIHIYYSKGWFGSND
jgi:hypothetical protein